MSFSAQSKPVKCRCFATILSVWLLPWDNDRSFKLFSEVVKVYLQGHERIMQIKGWNWAFTVVYKLKLLWNGIPGKETSRFPSLYTSCMLDFFFQYFPWTLKTTES